MTVIQDQVWMALLLTFQLGLVSVLSLVIIALPLCFWLAQYQGKFKPLLEALIALPLVLPPTVLGFYLLITFSPDTFLGQAWISLTGEQLAFSFTGILLGSVIYSLPFVVQPILLSFQQHLLGVLNTAKTLGIPRWRAVLFILLPTCKPAVITAMTLGFAHTLGEFGLILMIGGNIPGKTQVLSIALYQSVETMHYQQAHLIAGMLLTCALALLVVMYTYNRKFYLTQLPSTHPQRLSQNRNVFNVRS